MSGLPAASSMVLMMISSGTASSAPVVPQTQAQKLSDSRISSGLMVSRRPTTRRRDEIGLDQVDGDEDQRRQQRVPGIGEGHQPAQREQQRRGDRPEIGDVVEHRDDAAPHQRRRHVEQIEDQRQDQAHADIHDGDGAEIGRGRVDHLLDHPRRGHRPVEAGARGDRPLAHPRPARRGRRRSPAPRRTSGSRRTAPSWR